MLFQAQTREVTFRCHQVTGAWAGNTPWCVPHEAIPSSSTLWPQNEQTHGEDGLGKGTGPSKAE